MVPNLTYNKILYWHVNRLKRSSQSGPTRVKDGDGASVTHKEFFQERWAKYFENVLNHDKVEGNTIKKLTSVSIVCKCNKINLVRRGRHSTKND